ncbi:spermidine/putrescine ABC transporter permease [Spiroplasma turonicum]|uniref:Spermidine/putrescine ABC transporter permease n=1 Tax=Spiroplasma turonicum TaxID=216946 RepID=A0A0K1P4Y8_9MOLU|nr:spermidine/putrescine ABC transporter permease [Spiroplasma turonicum]AKU79370.1 spermidine/putrescine ABC transporter permease [Spiroplasma turonicum]ALX70392.1 spermidine/putrescine ABC transporter permease [Spiroplasma turonicum]
MNNNPLTDTNINNENHELQTELNEIDNIEAVYDSEIPDTHKVKLKEKIGNFRIFKSMKKKVWPVLLPFMIVMSILVILPLIGIIIFAIVDPTGDSVKFSVNLKNFLKLFTTGSIMLVLGLSLLYAFVASVITVIFAYPIALIMSQLKNKLLAKNMWVLVTLPIWISMILKILGLRSIFMILSGSIIGTPIAIVIGMIYMFLPFAIAPIYNALQNQDSIYYYAALDLKASKTKAFFHTTFRASLPGVFAGFTLVIVQAATSLLVVRYMGDGKINLITNIIENYFFRGTDFGYGAAVAVFLAFLLLIIMGVVKLISNKFEVRGSKKWKNSSNPVIS